MRRRIAIGGIYNIQLLVFMLVELLLLLLGRNVACEKCDQSALDKIDCHPERGATESECLRRGCCWLVESSKRNETSHYAGAGAAAAAADDDDVDNQPSCFFPADFNCYNIFRIFGLPAPEGASPQGEKDDLDGELHELYNLDNDAGPDKQPGSANGWPQRESNEATNRLIWLVERRPDCPASGFHDDAKRLRLELAVYGSSIINIKISDLDRPDRFEPKLPEINLPDITRIGRDGGIHNFESSNTNTNTNNSNQQKSSDDDNLLLFGGVNGQDELLMVGLNSSGDLLQVIHQNSGKILFEAQLQKLIYSGRFIQLPTRVGSSIVYGLGQHMGHQLLKQHQSKTYTMFNYGHPPQSDGRTAYSSYPFYINISPVPLAATTTGNKSEPPGTIYPMATGALMLNSNAMDVVLRSRFGAQNDDADDEGTITWRLVGGIVNLFLFAGPEPHDVVGQYQSLVGRPTLPPAWALGYHQSRLNYRQLLPIKEAWARTRAAGIPMESVWTDLDFLLRSTSYTVGNPELAELVAILQKDFGMHYVALVDPTISLQEDSASYEALKLATSMDLFAYNPANNSTGETSPAIVTGWPGRSILLDFTHSEIVNYLTRILQDYRQQLNFDGLWLDMNEPELFESNSCPQDEELQYWPGNRKLNDRTLCMAAQFEAGTHFDLHNLYAFYQTKAHYEALETLDSSSPRRPLLISRAQFVGQGKYGGSWLGDLSSIFEHMQWSLFGTIESNWFGQPMIGADICGFFGSASDELCARWFSLGAFYPLARNHNDGQARNQDPGALNEDVQRAARVALMKRYSLLPFLYSLFFQNHLEGVPVVSSTLFSFIKKFEWSSIHQITYTSEFEDQLVWGSALVVAPVLKAGTDKRHVHLPPGRWYDVSIGLPGTDLSEGPYDALKSNWPTDATAMDESLRAKGLREPIDCRRPHEGCLLRDQYTPLGSVNLFLRGGSILATFRKVSHLESINDMWKEPVFFLEVAMNEDTSASGGLYWDSGESRPADNSYNQVSFWASGNALWMMMLRDNYREYLEFDGFVVYGAKLDQPPKDRIYRNVKLVYSYDSARCILTCLFRSISDSDQEEHLQLRRYENIIIKW